VRPRSSFIGMRTNGNAAAESRQQAVYVASLLPGRHVLGGVLAAAVADAARVVRHDGVVAGERAGESGKAGAVHRRADHEQQRAVAPPLVVEPCARHVQGMSHQIGVRHGESPVRESLPGGASRGKTGPTRSLIGGRLAEELADRHTCPAENPADGTARRTDSRQCSGSRRRSPYRWRPSRSRSVCRRQARISRFATAGDQDLGGRRRRSRQRAEAVVGGVQQPPVSLHMPTDEQNEPRAT
jgi:hypothetical protein